MEDLYKDEYEIHHYGFPLKQLIFENQIIVKHKVKESVKSFTDKIIAQLQDKNPSTEAIQEIHKFSEKCYENIFDSFKDDFKIFDKLVKEHLEIPDNVILPMHFDHAKNYTENDEIELENEVKSMEETYKQNKYMLAALETELQTYRALEPLIEKENALSEMVENSPDEINKIDELKEIVKLLKIKKN